MEWLVRGRGSGRSGRVDEDLEKWGKEKSHPDLVVKEGGGEKKKCEEERGVFSYADHLRGRMHRNIFVCVPI